MAESTVEAMRDIELERRTMTIFPASRIALIRKLTLIASLTVRAKASSLAADALI